MFAGLKRLGKSIGSKPEDGDKAVPAEKEIEHHQQEEELVKQIAGLEEMVRKRTKDLEEARSHLSSLTVPGAGHEGIAVAAPEPPAGEGAGEPAGEAAVEKLFTMPNKGGEAPAVVAEEVMAAVVAPGAKETEPGGKEPEGKNPEETEPEETETKEKETKEAGSDASLSGIFNDDEPGENNLKGLIESLPDISAAQLLEEAREVQGIIRQWRGR